MSEPEKGIDAVYEDRNLLAVALAVVTRAPSAWTPDPESPDEWAIVWIGTPGGQVAWHVPRSLVAEDELPQADNDYDGYTRTEKNDRLTEWIGDGCPPK